MKELFNPSNANESNDDHNKRKPHYDVVRNQDDPLLTVEILKRIHPFLTDVQAESLLTFCKNETIHYYSCYGDGSIMFPMWIETCE